MKHKNEAKRTIYSGNERYITANITPYLTSGDTKFVTKMTSSISGLAEMSFGSMPNDGGALILTPEEKNELVKSFPASEKFIKPLLGSEEFLNSQLRYCLWITDNNRCEAENISYIKDRIDSCKKTREQSKRAATNKLAKMPHKFGEIRYKEKECIIVPEVSSEKRLYIPIGYLEKGTVITNRAFAIYDADLWLFGVVTSNMHLVWTKTFCGRLETRYNYSSTICYNTFPFPKISDSKKSEIEEAATEILLTREPYLTVGKTLADLYDPDTMPDDLREAHARLDDIVESCYPGYPFASDEARLECLFKMYEKMTKK